VLCASVTDGARYCREESDHQLIEDPAGMAQFPVALFCL
jgi:hypothetical protein